MTWKRNLRLGHHLHEASKRAFDEFWIGIAKQCVPRLVITHFCQDLTEPDRDFAVRSLKASRESGAERYDAAIAVLIAVGQDPNAPRNDRDPTPIAKMDHGYVVARAVADAEWRADTAARRDAAASFATAPVVQRTDCGCGGNGHAPHADGFANERAARDRMVHGNRIAYAAGTDRADEVEAIAKHSARMSPRAYRSAPARADGARKTDAQARAAMLVGSRGEYTESNGLAEAIRAGRLDVSKE